jgi:hypothetical protein
MRLNAITRDDADRLAFPGGPSNHNNALRTLRRMLGKAEEWNLIKAAPKIKLMQEHARERIIDVHIEAKLLPFCKQPLRDVLMIMRDSGMHNQKEVFTMRWEHVAPCTPPFVVPARRSDLKFASQNSAEESEGRKNSQTE